MNAGLFSFVPQQQRLPAFPRFPTWAGQPNTVLQTIRPKIPIAHCLAELKFSSTVVSRVPYRP